ncbi:MAG: XdhC family protein [Thermoguttaceae bacterium]
MYRKIVELLDGGVRLTAALVLSAEGSTPQGAGARALVDAAGQLWGTVGGGAVEHQARQMAMAACHSQRPVVFDCNLNAADAAASGAVCGGRLRILVDPTLARGRECYAQAAEALDGRRRGLLLTTIRTGRQVEVHLAWLAEDAIAAAATFPGGDTLRSCLVQGRPQRFVAQPPSPDGVEVFVEPVLPCPLLLIAGGGHVGQALAVQAAQVGFQVTVLDDRPEFADPARFPAGVRVRCGPPAEQLASCAMDADTYVVIVTRGHGHDAEALAACIHGRSAYLGMIGSRRKVALIRQGFLDGGLATQEEFARVFAPVGLEIGAVTVPEIAASIVAQLIAVRRNGAAHNAEVRR